MQGKHYGRSRRTIVRSLTLTVRALIEAVRSVLRDPETRALPFIAAGLVLGGTVLLVGVGILLALLTAVVQKYVAARS